MRCANSVLRAHIALFQSDLHQEAGYFFVPLASRLINDKSSHCKQLVNGTIKALLNKVAAILCPQKNLSMLCGNFR